MIRQLPKISLPSFMRNKGAVEQTIDDAAKLIVEPEVKHYDLITANTENNAEGNTMQLELF